MGRLMFGADSMVSEAFIRDILAECSRKPHSKHPGAGAAAIEIIRRIEALASKARDHLQQERRPYAGPARDGIEAQRGLNDVFPGDPCPPEGWRFFVCPECQGSGAIERGHPNAPHPTNTETCGSCEGSGDVEVETELVKMEDLEGPGLLARKP